MSGHPFDEIVEMVADARNEITDARDELVECLREGVEPDQVGRIIADCTVIARRCADIVNRLTKKS